MSERKLPELVGKVIESPVGQWWYAGDGTPVKVDPVAVYTKDDPWLFSDEKGRLYGISGPIDPTLEVLLVSNGAVTGTGE